jgi:DNA polymerase (family 10)
MKWRKTRNIYISEFFRELADILEIKGESQFKVQAYRKAAEIIAGLGEDVGDLLASGALRNIKGIGGAIERKVDEILTTGKLTALEKARSEIPPGVVEMLRIPGIGPKTARLLYEAAGIKGMDELESAIRDGKLDSIPGMGPSRVKRIKNGLDFIKGYGGRMLLSKALLMYDLVSQELKAIQGIREVAISGSARRMCEAVGDLDIVISADDVEDVKRRIMDRIPGVELSYFRSERISFELERGVKVDISITTPEEFPLILFFSTGSKKHVRRIVDLARSKGISISEDGVGFEDGRRAKIEKEEDIYGIVGLDPIPAELREDRGEIEAASSGSLPKLLELGDIKGDLHCHTNWSDGSASLEEIVGAGRALGYRYIAITDHSESLKVARGLSADKLLKQVEMIRSMNEDLLGIKLLAGTEVDILPDGSLDYPDDLLEKLDIVIASVHTNFGMSRDEMTGRILKALRNPYVDAIGHPTGRLIGERAGYEVDIEEVLKEASRRGVFLELNAHHDRLDLNDRNLRLAKEMGVKIIIGTDTHRLDNMGMMVLGVGTARRGWLEPEDVVNTMDYDELLHLLRSRKMRARGCEVR